MANQTCETSAAGLLVSGGKMVSNNSFMSSATHLVKKENVDVEVKESESKPVVTGERHKKRDGNGLDDSKAGGNDRTPSDASTAARAKGENELKAVVKQEPLEKRSMKSEDPNTGDDPTVDDKSKVVPTQTMQHASGAAHGTYEQVMILATGREEDYETIGNMLKHGDDFARGNVLRLLYVCLNRSVLTLSAAGLLRISDGLVSVLKGYKEMLGMGQSCGDFVVARDNSVVALGLLCYSARHACTWRCLNWCKPLSTVLCELVHEGAVDRCIIEMLIEYVALNNEFLPSLDQHTCEHGMLDTILSCFEHALGRGISSLEYPEYMTKPYDKQDADTMIWVCLSICYHYAGWIPAASLALPRFVSVMSACIGGTHARFQPMLLCVAHRLFVRFAHEFDVCDKFVDRVALLLRNDACRQPAFAILSIIRDECIQQQQQHSLIQNEH